jgi:hypothetical protein
VTFRPESEPAHSATTDWKAGCGRTACPVWVGGDGVIRPLSTLAGWKTRRYEVGGLM